MCHSLGALRKVFTLGLEGNTCRKAMVLDAKLGAGFGDQRRQSRNAIRTKPNYN